MRGATIPFVSAHCGGAGCADLLPLEIDFDTQIDIWLTYRSDAKRIARIRRTIDWLIQAYDPRRFPWFRYEFVHPACFAEIYKGKVLTSALATVRATR